MLLLLSLFLLFLLLFLFTYAISFIEELLSYPPPIIEGIAQMLSNWERLIEIQTCAAEIQVQAIEAQAQVSRSQTQGQSSMTSGSTFEQFKKFYPLTFKGEYDPIVAESWTLCDAPKQGVPIITYQPVEIPVDIE